MPLCQAQNQLAETQQCSTLRAASRRRSRGNSPRPRTISATKAAPSTPRQNRATAVPTSGSAHFTAASPQETIR
jgi:hypothetical protein